MEIAQLAALSMSKFYYLNFAGINSLYPYYTINHIKNKPTSLKTPLASRFLLFYIGVKGRGLILKHTSNTYKYCNKI